MRQRWHALVVVGPGGEERARARIAALRNADSMLASCRFEILEISALDLAKAERFDLALFDESACVPQREARRLADELAHLRIAVLQICDAPAAEGAQQQHSLDYPAINVHDDPPAAAVMIATILERQEIIRQMRQELQVAQRFQGGLRGEISRMHDEMQLAAMVQREFLPGALPCLHGVDIAALWRPANYVSGDIYDVSRLDEDHVGVFIADAVGHGVPAALMTMVIARALPTKEINGRSYRIVPPDEALRRLNTEMIRRQGDTTRFATALYAVIDCRSRTVRLAGAGHPPPLLYRRDEEPHALETTGGLLGVFDDESFDAIEFDLHLDDTLLLYSDGFEVAFPDDVSTGRSIKMPTRRYRDEFDSISAMTSASHMIREIAGRLDSQPGSLHQNDDLTLICIKASDLDPDQSRLTRTAGMLGRVSTSA